MAAAIVETPKAKAEDESYQQHIPDHHSFVRQKTHNLNRLEAQRNNFNSKVGMLREGLQLLQEPGSNVGEVVKVMEKSNVLGTKTLILANDVMPYQTELSSRIFTGVSVANRLRKFAAQLLEISETPISWVPLERTHSERKTVAIAVVEKPKAKAGDDESLSATATATATKATTMKHGEGLRQYYQQHIHDLQLLIRQKTHNLNRLKAQRNNLNSKVNMLREELQLLQEPGLYLGEVVKVMGKSKVLVKRLQMCRVGIIRARPVLRAGGH
ncbi:hypothetical protein MRB53_006167 [Persea americana]|uniref:Uncharacterized protein n=1 Tax=Persea americana TaxID=3435 RepID=A0ACC2MFL5_PERAE|nr:hypothetical protein MRB53_006167 [Persea americana]